MSDREQKSSVDESNGWESDLALDDIPPYEDYGEDGVVDEVEVTAKSDGEADFESEAGDPQDAARAHARTERQKSPSRRRGRKHARVDSLTERTAPDCEDGEDQHVKPRRDTSAGLVGFFYFLSVLAGAAAAGYAVLQVLGGRFQQLLEVQHPSFVLLTATAGGLVILGLLGALALGSTVGRMGRRAGRAEVILHKITQLDLEEDGGWQDEDYDDYPTLATNLERLKSTHELLRIRHARAVELEMEVQRLEAAITQRASSELMAEFSHPLTAQLADEAAHLVKDEADLRGRLDDLNAQLVSAGGQICNDVREAGDWNEGMKNEVHAQSLALTGPLTDVTSLAHRISELHQIARADSEVVTTLDDLKDRLVSSEAGAHPGELAEIASGLRESVEKIAGISFQIAINVARLGQDGVMLLPLTQQLESMTGDFKSVAARMDAISGHEGEQSTLVQQLKKDLQVLIGQAAPTSSADTTWDSVVDRIQNLSQTLLLVTRSLSELPARFDQQTNRLNGLGQTGAELTGADYTPVEATATEAIDLPTVEAVPEPVAASDLGVEPRPMEKETGPVAKPPPSEEGIFREPTSLFQPVADDAWNKPDGELTAESPATGRVDVLSDDPAGNTADEAVSATQPPLPPEEDRVYDLTEFGAVALGDDDAAAAADADRIYDLEELGAVALS